MVGTKIEANIEIEETNTEVSNLRDKINKDFSRSQAYNREHMKSPISYKLVRCFFWLGFWIGLVQ